MYLWKLLQNHRLQNDLENHKNPKTISALELYVLCNQVILIYKIIFLRYYLIVFFYTGLELHTHISVINIK